MGTDIWLHVEYLDCKKQRYKHSRADFRHDRFYPLFELLGGRGAGNPVYHQRGLPGDLTDETIQEYKDGEPEFHDASWLTTMEFRECLDILHEQLEDLPHDKEEYVYRLSRLYANEPEPIECYEQIYRYMKESDDEGEPARIVFWFDN